MKAGVYSRWAQIRGALISLGLAWVLAAASALAQAEGAALYAPCVVCHGADAAGNPSLGAPALAGQSQTYLSRQLRHYRSGMRGSAEGDSFGAQMQPFARQLADDDAVDAVATYLAALPTVAAATVATGNLRKGANLYNGNCGACHGGAGEGNEALNSPRLAGLDSAYLTRQIENYRKGYRGGDPEDRPGRQMAMMANSVDEAGLADVLAYIGTLGGGGSSPDSP